MTYSIINGYSPRSYETILSACVEIVNDEFGTNYTTQSFVGTNLWKFLYTTIQGLMTVENNIAELSVKMQDYIRTQNEELIIPRSSVDGIMQATEEELGLVSSIKPVEQEEDAGYIYLAVDVDNTAEDYAETKQKILKLLHENMGAGLFYQGTETGTVTATNGQAFNYAYSLPTEVNMYVNIVVTVSENSTLFIETPPEIKKKFMANFKEKYRLGYDFEPQTYLCKDDLPFAGKIDITYSTDGTNYQSSIWQSAYNQKVIIDENNVNVEVE